MSFRFLTAGESWKEIMSVSPLSESCLERIVSVPRPGHADLVGGIKYQHKDMRNVLERASARETAIGFHAASQRGSEVHDPCASVSGTKLRYLKNSAGGIEGGMSTGDAAAAHVERSDVCAVPAAAVIGESLLALTLSESLLEKFGGDSLSEISQRIEDWRRMCPVE